MKSAMILPCLFVGTILMFVCDSVRSNDQKRNLRDSTTVTAQLRDGRVTACIGRLLARVRSADYSVQDSICEYRLAGMDDSLGNIWQTGGRDARQLALHILDCRGGTMALMVFRRGLADTIPELRSVAMDGLGHHLEAGDSSILFDALSREREHPLQMKLIRILGQMEGCPYGDALLAREKTGRDIQEIRDALLAASSKLGVVVAREMFAKRLTGAPADGKDAIVNWAVYVDQPWVIGPLTHLLDDTAAAWYSGVHDHPTIPEMMRVCDLAVNAIARIMRNDPSFNTRWKNLPFPTGRATNYSAEQILKIKERLARM